MWKQTVCLRLTAVSPGDPPTPLPSVRAAAENLSEGLPFIGSLQKPSEQVKPAFGNRPMAGAGSGGGGGGGGAEPQRVAASRTDDRRKQEGRQMRKGRPLIRRLETNAAGGNEAREGSGRH